MFLISTFQDLLPDIVGSVRNCKIKFLIFCVILPTRLRKRGKQLGNNGDDHIVVPLTMTVRNRDVFFVTSLVVG